MKTIVFTLALICLHAVTATAQVEVVTKRSPSTFEERTKAIADKIDAITKEEKNALKAEVEAVNEQLEGGLITTAEADARKLELAAIRARNIETRTEAIQAELNQLIQDRVEGKITDRDTTDGETIFIRWKSKKKNSKPKMKGESRTTSQFVFAAGLNNVITNETMAHSDYKVWGSHFYEWGLTYNTRLFKNHNLLHAKYGLSLQYNNLRPTENRFQDVAGDETILVESPIHLKESRFRNVNVVVPVHLEFDFTKTKTDGDRKIFRSHDSFRLGIGGYVGGNIKSKQILKFEDEDGNNVKQRIKGDYNVNDLIYGVSAYAGYGEIALYVKYDLNPVFENNAVDQRNISMGLRFDLN